MVEIIAGIVSGVVSGAGMGGGTILILILSNFMGVDQHIAQATNLIFFIPTSIVAIIINFKQKLIDYKLGIIIAIVGSIGAFLGAKLALNINSADLKKYFGIFLLIIAIYEIYNTFCKYKKEKNTNNTIDKNL